MSILNNNKNSKDKKKGLAQQKSAFTGPGKGKTNTKGVTRQTKQNTGSQRGS